MGIDQLEPSLSEILAGKFQYESNLQTATPSGNYFWFRNDNSIDLAYCSEVVEHVRVWLSCLSSVGSTQN